MEDFESCEKLNEHLMLSGEKKNEIFVVIIIIYFLKKLKYHNEPTSRLECSAPCPIKNILNISCSSPIISRFIEKYKFATFAVLLFTIHIAFQFASLILMEIA